MYILHILFFKIQKILNHNYGRHHFLLATCVKYILHLQVIKISNNNEPFAIITR